MGSKLLFSLGTALLGMAVVFLGLLILIGFIKVLSVFSSDKKKQKTESGNGPVKSAPVQKAEEASASDSVPPEIVAAITAAIAAVWDSPKGFRVRHIRRVSNAPAWNRAGREEQIYSRL